MVQKASTKTQHEHFVFLAKKKLRLMGYEVYERGKRLRMKAKERGFYYPTLSRADIYAEKNNEPLIVEVHCGRLARQLQDYRKLGKIILVLPINVQGIQLWGINELETQ